MTPVKIKVITTVADMLNQFSLIKQLSPDVSAAQYEAMLKDMIKCNYKQAVAYLNEIPIGVCGFWINTKIYSGKYVELDNVVIDTQYRNYQIGQQLCNYVIQLAAKEGCKVAMLDAYLKNEKAHQFYERNGFQTKGYHFIKKL